MGGRESHRGFFSTFPSSIPFANYPITCNSTRLESNIQEKELLIFLLINLKTSIFIPNPKTAQIPDHNSINFLYFLLSYFKDTMLVSTLNLFLALYLRNYPWWCLGVLYVLPRISYKQLASFTVFYLWSSLMFVKGHKTQ